MRQVQPQRSPNVPCISPVRGRLQCNKTLYKMKQNEILTRRRVHSLVQNSMPGDTEGPIVNPTLTKIKATPQTDFFLRYCMSPLLEHALETKSAFDLFDLQVLMGAIQPRFKTFFFWFDARRFVEIALAIVDVDFFAISFYLW
jgi:hypothetical protein